MGRILNKNGDSQNGGFNFADSFRRGSSFPREARFAEEARFAGEARFVGEARFAGEAFFSRQARFAVNSTKTFMFILVVKHITYNTKVGEIMSFCDFFSKKLCRQQ